MAPFVIGSPSPLIAALPCLAQAHRQFHRGALIETLDADKCRTAERGENVLDIHALGHEQFRQRWRWHNNLIPCLLDLLNEAENALARVVYLLASLPCRSSASGKSNSDRIVLSKATIEGVTLPATGV